MAQAAYLHEGDTGGNAGRVPVAVARDVLAPVICLMGDGPGLQDMAQACRRCGMDVRPSRPLASMAAGAAIALGDVVYVEADNLTGADLAALVRLDERAVRAGAEVVISTTPDSLEDVFACMERARVQLLVGATPAERLVAIAGAAACLPGSRLRELDEEDRLAMLRLSQEVAQLARRLDELSLPVREGGWNSAPVPARLASPGASYWGPEDGDRIRNLRAPAPDPRLIHRIIRQRRLRDRFLPSELFSDPAWDILLDLVAARAEHRRVSVTSLCIAAAVPTTTALRWIAQMTQAGLLVREQDPQDRRRTFIALSDRVADAMARYFAELGTDGVNVI